MRESIRGEFKELRLDATAVVNCKRVIPFAPIGAPVSFFAWDSETETRSDDDKELLSGIVVGYIKDRVGHTRNYVIKTDRAFHPLFEDGSDTQYWIDGDRALEQFPEVELHPSEILVFVKYINVQSSQPREYEESK